MRPLWRALAALAGLLLAGIWLLASGLAFGFSECAHGFQSRFCAENGDLVETFEVVLFVAGTIVPLAGGTIAAWTGSMRWMAGTLVLMFALAFCADLVVSVQTPLPG